MSEEILIRDRTRRMDCLKLFNIIRDLSESHYAKVLVKQEITVVSFFTRGVSEFVCKWKFDNYFFNTELKELFNKHNSTTQVERKEQ